ncbi:MULTISPECIES: hypothetical protein [unclassified Bradyrhizobium]|uniref:hypothetical protein n=1 Tax=unclassified Bradyrhizobium TaxID=2631580 RepID=UPI001FF68F1D|nr:MULTISPECIES: hypothetical protein [unclassified Bradyrhizobium]MCJ9700751.1 hypothetical protein [Bradyrhizobium sp. SHOUNA76]MCJ9729246.1 hypothetical protein [Bradyrhizobium sp. PRIMUS42]
MTPKRTLQQTSRRQSGDEPRRDKKRDTQDPIIEDSGETRDSGRDLGHGEGGTINLPEKPGDLSKDD